MDLARWALIASGVCQTAQQERYLVGLDRLCRAIAPIGAVDDVQRAKQVFDHLWRAKPDRYRRGGSFRLGDLIDAHLGEGESTGNCLGLTLLYNVLAQRLGLTARAIYLDEAFGVGPHVFTLLQAGERFIDIEHMFPYGFDYGGHRDNPRRQQWDIRELVAEVHHSVGNRFFRQGELEKAILSYDEGIRLNPAHATLRLNKGIALVEMGETAEAMRWL